MDPVGRPQILYGSEGWGFESLRVHSCRELVRHAAAMRWGVSAGRLAAAAACFVLAGVAARDGGLHLLHGSLRTAPPPRAPVRHSRPSAGKAGSGHGGPHVPAVVWVVLAVAVALVVLALLVLLVRAVVRTGWRPRLPSFHHEPHDDGGAGGIAELDPELVARSTVAAIAALDASDEPRTAVIAAYAGMVDTLEAAGAGGVVVLTPARLLVRAAAAGLIGGDDAQLLTRLFERARFSTQEITAADVADARLRLDAVRAHLAIAVPA